MPASTAEISTLTRPRDCRCTYRGHVLTVRHDPYAWPGWAYLCYITTPEGQDLTWHRAPTSASAYRAGRERVRRRLAKMQELAPPGSTPLHLLTY